MLLCGRRVYPPPYPPPIGPQKLLFPNQLVRVTIFDRSEKRLNFDTSKKSVLARFDVHVGAYMGPCWAPFWGSNTVQHALQVGCRCQ